MIFKLTTSVFRFRPGDIILPVGQVDVDFGGTTVVKYFYLGPDGKVYDTYVRDTDSWCEEVL